MLQVYDQLYQLLSKMPLSDKDMFAKSLALYALGLKSSVYRIDNVTFDCFTFMKT